MCSCQILIISILATIPHIQLITQPLEEVDQHEIAHPSYHYEELRRRIEKNIKELWTLARSDLESEMDIQMLAENKNLLLSDMQDLRQSDGHDEWRQREILELGDIVQRRLHYLQNPSDCSKARKLVCSTISMCGLGCKMHNLVRCLMIAYASNRTLLLDDENRKIYKAAVWTDLFLPLSNTCRTQEGRTSGNWSEHFQPDDPVQVLVLPVGLKFDPRPSYFSPALPADLGRRMVRVLVNPAAWWITQFLKYIIRMQPEVEKLLEEKANEIVGREGPLVGIQVRRTDKLEKEADFHPLEEYMEAVKDFYDKLEMKGQEKKVERRVFIASDDPSVHREAKSKYPEYTFLGVKKAPSIRYSRVGLMSILSDTFILSRCDFVVCTFSSNVCRMAYEMKMAARPQLTEDFVSLDWDYHMHMSPIHRRAVLPHQPRSPEEIDLHPGDLLTDPANHTVSPIGMREGVNDATNVSGIYPSFKVEAVLPFANFPNYSEIENYGEGTKEGKH